MSSSDALPDSPASDRDDAALAIPGVLHVFVAFDWGEEVDLEHARRLVPSEPHAFPRPRRTPSSIAYRPSPLQIEPAPVTLELAEIGVVEARVEATVFDFAAASIALSVPFRLTPSALLGLAGSLADASVPAQAARSAAEPLFQRLLPAIQRPQWGHTSEEYFVFAFDPGALPPVPQLLADRAAWLAGLVRLDPEPLVAEEIAEALRIQLRYRPTDLFVPDWAAAVLIDQDCADTLQVIEFANLQLSEFREIDDRLDQQLAAAYGLMHALAQRRLPFWRPQTRQMRALGEIKVEANTMFERTSNALKLVGDQYLARVNRLLAERFHLEAWEQSIRRSLEVLEGGYQVVSDQAAGYRAEVLEAIIAVLILVDVLTTLLG